MEYRRLGQGGPLVSRIGFGCWAIGGHGYGAVDDQESERAICAALDAGINFFDTADVYGFGRSEEVLSRALGGRIKDAVIATKFGVNWDASNRTFKDCSPKRVFEAVEGSLRRLKLDTIPLYQIHWHDKITPIDETMCALEKCRAEGKILHVGVSNFSLGLTGMALRAGPLASFQVEYGLANMGSADDVKRAARELGLGVIAYGVLSRGLLSGKYPVGHGFGPGDTRSRDFPADAKKTAGVQGVASALGRVAARRECTSAQAAIAWALSNDDVTIALTGIKTASQAMENAVAAKVVLSSDDFDELGASL